MRRGIGVSILLIVLIAGAAVANQVAVNLQSIVVEDFNDNGSRWIARGSKFLAVDGGQMRFDHPFVYQYVEGVWPEAMMRPATDSPRVFGVQASFTAPGTTTSSSFQSRTATTRTGTRSPGPSSFRAGRSRSTSGRGAPTTTTTWKLTYATTVESCTPSSLAISTLPDGGTFAPTFRTISRGPFALFPRVVRCTSRRSCSGPALVSRSPGSTSISIRSRCSPTCLRIHLTVTASPIPISCGMSGALSSDSRRDP
jgi:hypothetical protein